jgi:hypothetical protein
MLNGDKSMGGARNVVGDGVIEDVVIREQLHRRERQPSVAARSTSTEAGTR